MIILGVGETALVGVGVAIVSLFAAAITAAFALKGKRVEAGEWLTDELRTDAEESRKKVSEAKREFEEYRIKKELEFELYKEKTNAEMNVLKEAIAELKSKEKELLTYIQIFQKEMDSFKELYLANVGSTPNITFYEVDPEKLKASLEDDEK